MRKSRARTALSMTGLAVLALSGGGIALAAGLGGDPPGFLKQVADITTPAPFSSSTSFDISYVDAGTHTYYLADRSNNGVLSVNTITNSFNSVVGAGDFSGANAPVTPAQTAACGNSVHGPNGVVGLTVGGVNQLWATDGVSAAHPVSNVKVFTVTGPTSATLAATIGTAVAANGTAGTCRLDEVAYDPQDRLFLAANDVDPTPYVSLISVNPNPALDQVVAQIKFPAATGGIEQTIYDAKTRMFYTNLPGVEVAVINPATRTVSTTYPTPSDCVATGLALNPKTQQLLLSCNPPDPNGVAFMNAKNGAITARVPQVSGADEVWYDPGTGNFYLGAAKMTSTSQNLPTVTTAGSGTSWTVSETGATGGTFTLTVGTSTTTDLAFNTTASTVQTSLATLVPGTVVSGGPLPGTPLKVTFPSAQTTFTANGVNLQPGGYAMPVLGVINGNAPGNPAKVQWLENFSTGSTAFNAHSVAADPSNNEVFVPMAGLGLIVFAWTH